MTTSSFPMYQDVGSSLPTLHMICGRILTDATTPTISSGKGFTVSKPASGRYQIHLNKKCKIIAAIGQLAQASSENKFLRKTVWNSSVEGAGIVEFAEVTLQDFASTDEIEFCIFVMLTTSLPD